MQESKSAAADKGKNPSPAVWPAISDIQVEAIGRETGEPGWMVDARRDALAEYRRMTPPSSADEDWRCGGLLQYPFSELNLEALTVSGKPKRPPAAWVKPVAGGKAEGFLAMEDRAVRTASLDDDLRRTGVVFAPLSLAAKEHPDLVRSLLGSAVPAADGRFAALASVICDTGFLLHAPKGARIEKPLHALLWSSGEGLRAWRLLVNVEQGAEVDLLVECASPERKEGAARLNITELIVHRDARLRFFLTQAWGGNVVRIAHERAIVHRNGRLEWGGAHFGASSSKSFSALDLKEEGASAEWFGLRILDGGQTGDSATRVGHLAPKTRCDFLDKSVLSGEARSFWRGMLRVEAGAPGADGYQGSRTLMLSDRAQAESVPGLEILSDDVRCSHGVSIGELDPGELFYARSRGIPLEESRNLLIGGFLETVLGRIGQEDIRRRVHLAVAAKMETMEGGFLQSGNTGRKETEPDGMGATG
jgi:Fe-S cluster assembly protein SufD